MVNYREFQIVSAVPFGQICDRTSSTLRQNYDLACTIHLSMYGIEFNHPLSLKNIKNFAVGFKMMARTISTLCILDYFFFFYSILHGKL